MALDDDHGSDYNASDSGNEGQRPKADVSKRASSVLDKNTKSMDVENGTYSAMFRRGSESADGVQQAITDNLRKGFSELTAVLSSQLIQVIGQSQSTKRSRKRSASESSTSNESTASDNEDTRRATKRACRQPSSDVDADIDGLLQQDEDQGKPNDPSNSPPGESDILGSIAEEYDLDEQCAEEINPKLAAIVNKMVRNRLTEEKLKEKLSQSIRPTNCDNLSGTKVNPEIWRKLQATTRSRDIKMQRLENTLLKATIPIVKVVHQLMSSDSTHPIDNKGIVKSLMDSVALLGHTNCELVQRGRDLIRPGLNDQYQQICSEHILFSSWLFGDDLPKQVQDISATNRVSQQLSSSRHNDRQKTGPHRQASHSRGQYNPNFRRGREWQKPPYKNKRRHQKPLKDQ